MRQKPSLQSAKNAQQRRYTKKLCRDLGLYQINKENHFVEALCRDEKRYEIREKCPISTESTKFSLEGKKRELGKIR
ncbi:MAG: hypothetical protein GX540_01700 [Clostridiales bacterium]|nr:hypothetical protein [Clostridiales bacterium]